MLQVKPVLVEKQHSFPPTKGKYQPETKQPNHKASTIYAGCHLGYYRKMTEPHTIILGLESSCDETAAAIVRSDRTILAQQIASSATLHAKHGGVVPEIAARQHLDVIDKVIDSVCKEAGCQLTELDGIAATGGPGLIGGVLVGTMIAKAIASALAIPYFAVNHLEGHALTARLTDDIAYLSAAGVRGHTQLLNVLAQAIISDWAQPWMMQQEKPLINLQLC